MKKRFIHLFTALVCCAAVNNLSAQTRTTEIWLADLGMKDNKYVVTNPIRITANDFYDNQPCFSKDGSLLWFASMPDTTQSDIYEYNIKKKEFRQVTNTTESEYQPTQLPNNNNRLSVVRVDADQAQRFYSVEMDGTGWEMLAPTEDSVAYYAWMNDTTVALNILNGGGGILEQYDRNIQQSIIIMNGGFGRCLAHVQGTNNFSYVQKSSNGSNLLMIYKMDTGDREPVIELPEGVEDYAWAPGGRLICSDNSKLYTVDPKSDDPKWLESADFTKTVGTMYRLAVSPKGDKIALVSYKGTKP